MFSFKHFCIQLKLGNNAVGNVLETVLLQCITYYCSKSSVVLFSNILLYLPC